jgi:hypothetical protein
MIRDFFVLMDFMVLEMEVDKKIPLILGRPFLSTANAHINMGAGEIQFNINMGPRRNSTSSQKSSNAR